MARPLSPTLVTRGTHSFLHARALDSSRTERVGGPRAGTAIFAAKIL